MIQEVMEFINLQQGNSEVGNTKLTLVSRVTCLELNPGLLRNLASNVDLLLVNCTDVSVKRLMRLEILNCMPTTKAPPYLVVWVMVVVSSEGSVATTLVDALDR
jgi:hypothetical protein